MPRPRSAPASIPRPPWRASSASAWSSRSAGPAAPTKAKVETAAPVDDADGDKVIGEADQCPERAEDPDSYEDDDGCPDIDNDGDRVLDDVDKCGVPESVNGFEDYDGCPDTVPAELEAKLGVIAGLSFAAGKADIPDKADAALRAVAALVTTWPSIKLVLVGHAGPDDAIPGEGDDDGSAAAQATSLARAEAVPDPALRARRLARQPGARGQGHRRAGQRQGRRPAPRRGPAVRPEPLSQHVSFWRDDPARSSVPHGPRHPAP
jgi:outer membrane protein OmpA-like peptidoglycan-associated protein